MFNAQFVASATFVRPITAILIIAVYSVIQGKIAAGWGKSQLQKFFAAPGIFVQFLRMQFLDAEAVK